MTKRIILDVECYRNFWLMGWADVDQGTYLPLTEKHLAWVERQLRDQPYLITFNGLHYDLRLLMYALKHRHKSAAQLLRELKAFSDYIIVGRSAVNLEAGEYFDQYRWWPHPSLDLKQMLGGRICPSLKKLACRLHLAEVEALPISPDTVLSDEQKAVLTRYNKLDCLNTLRLLNHCRPQLDMRLALGKIYKVDCRSLGDAQIAEKVLFPGKRQYWPRFGGEPVLLDDILYDFQFGVAQLRHFMTTLRETSVCFRNVYHPGKGKRTWVKWFEKDGDKFGNIKIEDVVPNVDFRFGGLHSVHKGKSLRGEQAWDVDVASYYPHLILRFAIFPQHLGDSFLKVYKQILERRLAAKKAGRKAEADGLKIVLNSVFGKYNEQYSQLFDPVAGASVCLHGQLGLLRLMDLCYQNGVTNILMVNTDGIVTAEDPTAAILAWEREMNMVLETKKIKRYVIKDSNNHVLQYDDNSLKVKGTHFAFEQTSSKQTNFAAVRRAVVNHLLYGTFVESTLKECRNLHEFLGAYSKGPTIQQVKKALNPQDPGEPMPDLCRYYLGAGDHHLYRRNAKTWTRCADTQGFVVANAIPLEWPQDLDYTKYVQMAESLLRKL
jgi:hypothetical protein